MTPRRALAPLLIAFTAPLWGCPPSLTGELCDGDCACPTSQTCVFLSGAKTGSCQDGTNTCAGITDGGDGGLPDAGDAGSTLQFEGTVVLNGGAVPPNATKVYGFADGTPVTSSGGIYASADLAGLAGSDGAFTFSGSVPSPTGDGYRFVAVYDTKGRGDYDINDDGIFNQLSIDSLAPGSSAATRVHIDVETSTCYSLTTEFQQTATTYLIGVGTVAYDVSTGVPLIHQGDLDAVGVIFDAGSALPANFAPPQEPWPLSPAGTLPGGLVNDSWVYGGSTALSNTGTFFFTLTDSSKATPQYPAGSCAVTYTSPPGFPQNLAIDGVDGGNAQWQNAISSGGGPKGTNLLSWSDFGETIPPGFFLGGDLVSIVVPDPSNPGGPQALLYPLPDAGPEQTQHSPLSLPFAVVPTGVCDTGSSNYCWLEVTSLYLDGRKPHNTPFEGGTTILTFQRVAIGPGD